MKIFSSFLFCLFFSYSFPHTVGNRAPTELSYLIQTLNHHQSKELKALFDSINKSSKIWSQESLQSIVKSAIYSEVLSLAQDKAILEQPNSDQIQALYKKIESKKYNLFLSWIALSLLQDYQSSQKIEDSSLKERKQKMLERYFNYWANEFLNQPIKQMNKISEDIALVVLSRLDKELQFGPSFASTYTGTSGQDLLLHWVMLEPASSSKLEHPQEAIDKLMEQFRN